MSSGIITTGRWHEILHRMWVKRSDCRATPWNSDFRCWIPVFVLEPGFWISIVSGIQDSLSCILDSKAQDSGFHKQTFPRFRIPGEKIPGFRFALNVSKLQQSNRG